MPAHTTYRLRNGRLYWNVKRGKVTLARGNALTADQACRDAARYLRMFP